MYCRINDGSVVGKITVLPNPLKLLTGETVIGSPTDQHILAAGYFPYVPPSYNTETHKLGGYLVGETSVTHEVLPLTQEELDIKAAAKDEEELIDVQYQGSKLFFELCKILIEDGVLTPTDPRLANIKAEYLRWAQLTGN